MTREESDLINFGTIEELRELADRLAKERDHWKEQAELANLDWMLAVQKQKEHGSGERGEG